jgi:ribosomal protein S27E
MATKKAKKPALIEHQEVVFQVASKCTECGSELRTYNKNSKQTRCNSCGKKQPNPRIDMDKIEFFDERPDLSLEKKVTALEEIPICSFCNPTIPTNYNPVEHLSETIKGENLVCVCNKCNRVVLIYK